MQVISIFRENKQREEEEKGLISGVLWLMAGLTIAIITVWEVQTYLTYHYPTLGQVVINNFK